MHWRDLRAQRTERSTASALAAGHSRMPISPSCSRSPGWTSACLTRRPFRKVPLVEPRSMTTIRAPSRASIACRRDTESSPRTRSQDRERPITAGAVTVKPVRSPDGGSCGPASATQRRAVWEKRRRGQIAEQPSHHGRRASGKREVEPQLEGLCPERSARVAALQALHGPLADAFRQTLPHRSGCYAARQANGPATVPSGAKPRREFNPCMGRRYFRRPSRPPSE